jgi:hypothetical protein
MLETLVVAMILAHPAAVQAVRSDATAGRPTADLLHAAGCHDHACEIAAGEARFGGDGAGQIGLRIPGEAGVQDARAYRWAQRPVPFSIEYRADERRFSVNVDGVSSAQLDLEPTSSRGRAPRSLLMQLVKEGTGGAVELSNLLFTSSAGTDALDDLPAPQAGPGAAYLALSGFEPAQDWMLEGFIRLAAGDDAQVGARFALTDLAAAELAIAASTTVAR